MPPTDGKEEERVPRGEEDEEKRRNKLDRRKEDLKKAVLASGEGSSSLGITALDQFSIVGPKDRREIHIGGVVPEWQPIVIQSFLQEAMRQVGMSKLGDPPPIIGVRTSGWFAFAECRNPETANQLLNLDRIKFKNRFLRINRPTSYDGPADTNRKCWEDMVREHQLRKPATKVLRLANMLSEDDVANETTLKEVEEDTLEECNSIGKVVSIVVPRKTTEGKDGNAALPCVYVQFEHEDGSRMAQAILGSRLFDGRKVRADFYDEEKFKAQIFDPPSETTKCPSETTKCPDGPPAVTPKDGPVSNEAASVEENMDNVKEPEKTEAKGPTVVDDTLKEEALNGEEQEQEVEVNDN